MLNLTIVLGISHGFALLKEWRRLAQCGTVGAACLVAACDNPASVKAKDEPPPSRVQFTAASYQGSLTMDDYWRELARTEVPGFAGLYAEHGEVVLLTSQPARAAQAIERLRALHAGDPSLRGSIRTEAVKYNFAELRDWADLVLGETVAPILTYLDVDEVNNRVVVGIRPGKDVAKVIRYLRTRGVPADAFRVEVRHPLEMLGDIRNRVDPMPGAISIERGNYISDPEGEGCTLGFNVKANNSSGYAVTASHCSRLFAAQDTSSFYQPTLYYIVRLKEITDPGTFTGYPCPSLRVCRYSDVTLLQYQYFGDADPYKIAYPDFNGGFGFTSTTSQQAAWGETYVLAMPQVGLSLVYIGISTGRQDGYIMNTCFGGTGENNVYLPCNYELSTYPEEGDSGGPVFSGGGQFANVYGVLFGRAPSSNNHGVFSLWTEVRNDFSRVGITLTARP